MILVVLAGSKSLRFVVAPEQAAGLRIGDSPRLAGHEGRPDDRVKRFLGQYLSVDRVGVRNRLILDQQRAQRLPGGNIDFTIGLQTSLLLETHHRLFRLRPEVTIHGQLRRRLQARVECPLQRLDKLPM